MNKYERVIEELTTTGTSKMKVFGNSMTPILESGVLLTFVKQEEYEVGDIVFAKVKGRYIDAHKITKISPERGYMIANNHNWENGWTRMIYGKAISAEYQDGTTKQLTKPKTEENENN
jgi:SOS-response transcriptional repressor LexA